MNDNRIINGNPFIEYMEENKMSDSCKCPYSGLNLEELKLLDPEDLAKILDLAIPVLLKNGGQDEKIIQMASLLPNFERSSKETMTAIRAVVSWKVRGELYRYSPQVIESIGINYP